MEIALAFDYDMMTASEDCEMIELVLFYQIGIVEIHALYDK